MSEMGQFLETLYGSGEPFCAVRAVIRTFRDRALAESADGGNRSPIGRRNAAPPVEHGVDEAKLSIWLRCPGRYRIERDRRSADRAEHGIVIANDATQWEIDSQGRVETSQPRGGIDTDIARHFDLGLLREFFVGLALEQRGMVETAGRYCVCLRAVLRPKGRLWPHWLPSGADEYELHADIERGALLYIAGISRGKVFEVNEVSGVAFDEALDDRLFEYAPSAAQEVRPATPISERLTLEAAVERMPFTVLLPSRVSESAKGPFEVVYHPPRRNSPRACLSLFWYSDEPSLWIDQSDQADSDEIAKLEWEQIEIDGARLAISDPGVDGGTRVVVCERHGTHISAKSNLERAALVDVVASLAPAKL